MSELLPCPFCGATPDVDNRGSFTLEDQPKWAGVICCINGPEIRTGYEKWPAWRQAAIDAWNTRTPTPPGPADGGEAVERVALAILERRIKPDFHEVRDGAWTVDHDKELAIAAIAALRPQAADNGGRTKHTGRLAACWTISRRGLRSHPRQNGLSTRSTTPSSAFTRTTRPS